MIEDKLVIVEGLKREDEKKKEKKTLAFSVNLSASFVMSYNVLLAPCLLTAEMRLLRGCKRQDTRTCLDTINFIQLQVQLARPVTPFPPFYSRGLATH